MPLLIDIADAVAAELNAAELSLDFTAEVNLKPEFELKDLKTFKVTVVPKSLKISGATRLESAKEVRIDIGVQKKTADPEQLAALLQLVEEIAGIFDRKRLTGYQKAVCVGIENEPVYDPEHLRQFRQFTSVVTLKFRVT
ncbi:MAG: hypothetical protein PHH77_12590 [Victivallaceae bacterium]|nr:hypothetical protein [Victivallaceae bacterium]